MKTILISAMMLGFASLGLAQNGPGGRGFNGPRGHRPPPGPLIGILDANHDGVISADEIANASANLLKLDTNGDGQLTPDELRPMRPADAPPPPPDAVRHHRNSPLMLALDANGDGTLSAQEIANAPASLKALDTNHDGQLTPDEFRPLPPTDTPRSHG